MDECPVEDRIPIYLVVAGSVGLFSTCYRRREKRNTNYTSTSETRYSGDTTYTLTQTRYHPDTSQGDDQQIFNLVNRFRGLVKLFQLAWFVAGNVWIYSIYEPNYTDPTSPDFCNKTLYLFAFWVTNSYYIFFGVELVITFLIMGINAYAISAMLPPTDQSRNTYYDLSPNDWRTTDQSRNTYLFSRNDWRTTDQSRNTYRFSRNDWRTSYQENF